MHYVDEGPRNAAACVVMLHGWWASRIGGASANALTHEDLSDLGGGSALHDTWVEVERRA